MNIISTRTFHSRLILLLGLLILSPACLSGELPEEVARALLKAGVDQESVSVYIRRVDQPEPLVAHHADVPRNPASTMKLLTTYAGLEMLGPAYTWKTEAYTEGPIRDGVLEGDLILKGYGDPWLTLEHFRTFVAELRSKGLREIRGNLVLDRTWFENSVFDAGSFDGEPWRAYNAGPDALMVNFNSTRFDLSPDESLGQLRVESDPALPEILVINKVALSHGPCADWKRKLGYDVQKKPEGVNVTFNGTYSVDCGEKALELSVLSQPESVGSVFREFWQQQGGAFKGGLKLAETPPAAVLLLKFDSSSLADVIRPLNKYSNNVMARHLLMTIGAEKLGPPGDAKKGIRAIRDWLQSKQLEFPELVLENGAGLSRMERLSARHMGEMLRVAWQSPVMPEFVSSLPVLSVDGTMSKRLVSSDVAGRAHLKSGSLDGVKAIGGYLLDRKGRYWVIVFMVNHANAKASQPAQDALLEWLYDRD